MPDTFATYDRRDFATALTALAGMVECLGIEIADRMRETYPSKRHAAIVNWMIDQLDSVLTPV